MKYFANLNAVRTVLWCYFIWYLFFAARYFDANRNLWLTSFGIAIIVGVALMISTASPKTFGWPMFRLFLIPFCVSSFSSLMKGHGFILIFSPIARENYFAFGLCAAFCGFVFGVKMARR